MLRDKDKIYKESKIAKRKTVVMLSIIILVYAFFFTSKLIIKEPLSEATTVGVPLTYTMDRGVTIYDAIYDEDAELLEIVLNFTNSSGDDVNDYYFFLTAEGRYRYDDITVDVIYEDVMITVLRIPIKEFREAKLVFAPKVAEVSKVPENLVGTIVLNCDNLSYEKIKERTREDYIAYRYEVSIMQLKNEIANTEEEIKGYNEKIKALEKENKELSDNMKYYTKEEELTAKRQIKANEEKQESIRTSIISSEEELKRLDKRLDELDSLYGESKGGKNE